MDAFGGVLAPTQGGEAALQPVKPLKAVRMRVSRPAQDLDAQAVLLNHLLDDAGGRVH